MFQQPCVKPLSCLHAKLTPSAHPSFAVGHCRVGHYLLALVQINFFHASRLPHASVGRAVPALLISTSSGKACKTATQHNSRHELP